LSTLSFMVLSKPWHQISIYDWKNDSVCIDNFRMNTGMVDTAPLIIWLFFITNFHVFE
jgi:hypothetical protein